MGNLAMSAQNSLKGKVTDSAGEPLAGVMVMVQGTSNGAVTAADGSYSISVPDGAVIEYSCLGLSTITYKFNGTATHNVVMEEDSLFLDDAVVVGYGVQKKSSMTSAVSAIKGDELLKAPSTNVTQVLAGRLSGLSSVQESGEPGLDQASLRIRGSVYGVAYIVDGFPVESISDIDPADIESVSVLKDGASAAVYGLQAAGGVIIITTRKGSNDSVKVTYNASLGASMNANFPQFMNGPQYAYYYNMAQMMDQLANGEITAPDQYETYFKKADVEAMINGDPTDGWDNVDYIGKVFGTGFTQKHNLTVQGGSPKTKFFTSFGYMGQKGNIDNFGYKRYNLRANVETKVGRNFTYSLGLSGMLGNRHTPAYASGGSDSDFGYEAGWFSVARQAVQMHPFLPEKYDGHYTGAVQNNQSFLVSPLAAIYESGSKDNRIFSTSVNTSLKYDVPGVEGLNFKVAGSFSYGNTYTKNLSLPYTLMQLTKNAEGDFKWSQRTDCPHISDNVNNLGEASTYSMQLVGQASVNYAHSFGRNNIDAMALAELRDYSGNSLSAYAKKLPFASLPELSNGVATNDPVGGWSNETRSAGYVFRVRYDYDERYLAEFTGRVDGSYKFAGMSDTRWGFFPSVSVGWRISKENFMQSQNVIDDLKIRGSVGLLGNDSVSPYMFLSSYSQAANVALGVPGAETRIVPAYYTSGIANTNLTWEKTLSWNIGFDATLWDGLLGFEVDGFYNYTYDMLTYQSSGFPSSMGGYYPTWVNYNAIDAKGIDILVSHRNHFDLGGHPFYYDITASLTHSRTRWLRYKDEPNIVEYRKVVGTTYGSILCWQADGLFKSEEEIDNSSWYGTRPNVGDIKYVDLNGDGKIDEDDKGYFGRSNRPQLTYGLNFNLNWLGFDLNAQFTGGALFDVSLTGTYYNGYDDNTIWTQSFKEGGNSPLYLVKNAYTVYNTEAKFPRLTLSTTNHGGDNGLSSTFWIRDGRYVRLKTLQFGYTIPKKITEKARVEALRFFFEGQNLFTIDSLPEGIDPESPGVNNGYYPQQRMLMGGITLTF